MRTRERVHAAVCTVLLERGRDGLSVDHLAEASGVSRSTIYRTWPDLAGLTCEVFAELMTRDPLRLSDDPVRALQEYLGDYARRLNDPVYLAVLMAIIEGSAHDLEFAAAHRKAFSQTRSRAGSIVRKLQREGRIDTELSVAQCVEDIVAPFLYRRLITQQLISLNQVNQAHRLLLQRWDTRGVSR
jgi:AcrR family transcriptional regulator